MKSVKTIVLFAAMALVVVSCGKKYSQNSHGITVGNVRLEVVNDDVIRVVSVAKGPFHNIESLVTSYDYPKTRTWTVEQTPSGEVVLATSRIKAVVSTDGKVRFTDLEDNVILSETGEREVDGHVRQLWESGADEAYYGLGQHQADEFNWKDRNEQLFQYNTKISVPFVVSSRNYGILWDNCSWSRWGDARDYDQLCNVFKVYDKDGAEGGLTGVWTDMTGKQLVRTEPFLYFENIQANRQYLPEINLYGSDVVFDGYIEPSESGLFKFMVYYAGYVSVYLDDVPVAENIWRTAWNPNTRKFSARLTEGRKAHLRVTWQPDGGESYFAIRALSPRPVEEDGTIAFWSEAGKQIDYYFINGSNLDEVISGYRAVTGKAPIMPKWAMGFWQCRERYMTQQQILEVFGEFRKRSIPLDNIVQDWQYWEEDQWGSHEFDRNRFPDPQAMIDSIHAMNGHYMISVWPKFYANTEHFKEFDSKGWMYRRAIEDSLRDWVGPGYIGSFYDAYSADARTLFWNQMNEHLFKYGIDAWWMDASEPNIKDCVEMDYWKALCGPTALGSSTEYLNAYGLMNAMAIYDGQRSVAPDQRVFLLTRSGFLGLQRYSTAVWSGDIATRWEDMKAQISAGINFSMSGIPFWTMDIGGFCVEKRYEAAQRLFNEKGVENEDLKEWRELETRWYQFGAFCPLFRSHGQWPEREVFNVAPQGHPAYNAIVSYDKLRYRLMPYIYSLDGQVYLNDYTIMRGLAMDFGGDAEVLNVSDQYMFGPAILVNPVYTYGARERQVYLPENTGGWYDFYSTRHYDGGQMLMAAAPYDRMPLFVKAGSIIPMGPDVQYASESAGEEMDLFAYAGQDGRFLFYEDDGVSYNYEKGEYQTIEFIYDDSTRTVSAEKHGVYAGAPEKRTFHVHIVSPEGTYNTTLTVE